MAVCTYSDVFQFVGAPTDVQTTQQAAITALIANAVSYIEEMIGRKLEATSFTNVIFHDGLNCAIAGDTLYLKGIYRDTYTISALSEDGEALTAVAAYGDNGGYYLDKVKGAIIRAGADWSIEKFAVLVSGTLGIGAGKTPPALKQAVIEIAASKSGLWKQNVVTEGGTIETIRTTPSKETMSAVKLFIGRDI